MIKNIKRSLKSIHNRIFSDSNTIEQRIAGLFFVFGGLLAVASFASNVAMGFSPLMNSPTLIVIALCIYWSVRKKEFKYSMLRVILAITAFIYFPYMFFITGGIDGSAPMCFVMMILLIVATFKRGWRGILVGALIVWYIAVFVVSVRFPQFVVFVPEENRIIGLCMGIAFVGIMGAVIVSTVLVGYESERLRVIRLYGELQKKNLELKEMSIIDPLTGTYNRRHLFGVLEKEISEHLRNKTGMCVLMLDLDRFKEINDTYGHSSGDEVLKMTAKTIAGVLRPHDTLVRYGGEEFAVVLPGCAHGDAARISERIRLDIEKMTYRRGIGCTISIGVAGFQEGDSPESIIARADEKMYRAKEKGRNRVET